MFINTPQMDSIHKHGVKDFDKICAAHPGCIDCPLKNGQEKQYNEYVLRCVTGMNK